MMPVADLHNDLLSYLCDGPNRTPIETRSRCALPQLKQGEVALQVLAVFTRTQPRSVEIGQAQISWFQRLVADYADAVTPFQLPLQLPPSRVQLLFAFENASGFAQEGEPLARSIQRLEEVIGRVGRPLYISLTWNEANRFGGGADTTIGLKEDGKHLLSWMHQKKIALDLSHASDALAEEALNYLASHALQVPCMASHSNFRKITPGVRNLPDEIAQEIIHRKGLIGLNFFAPFIDAQDPKMLFKHIEHALHMGGENALAFGADFFCDDDFPDLKQKYKNTPAFFTDYKDAAQFPHILHQLSTRLGIPEEQRIKIAYRNVLAFLHTHFITAQSQMAPDFSSDRIV